MVCSFFKMINGKKGLSPVIAIIAIIFLSVAAVAFIAGFLVPFVKDKLAEGTECVDYKDYFSFDNEFGYNCYENASGELLYGLTVRAESVDEEVEEEVEGFKLQFLRDGGSQSIDVVNGSDAGSSEGEIRMLDASISKVEIPEDGGVRTYVYYDSEKFKSVEIFPLLKSGRTCDKSDSIKIETEICSESLT